MLTELDQALSTARTTTTPPLARSRTGPMRNSSAAARGLLLDIHGWRTEEIDDGVALPTELGRWPGGRALYDPRPGEPRLPGPGVSCRFCYSVTRPDHTTGTGRPHHGRTDTDTDELTALTVGEYGATVRRLTVPGTAPLAAVGGARVTDRFRAGAGGVYVTLRGPARPRGAAADGQVGGMLHHAGPYAPPGAECLCWRRDCGGLAPADWCTEHGWTVEPAIECHPGGRVTMVSAYKF
jgi:hypothetical protein